MILEITQSDRHAQAAQLLSTPKERYSQVDLNPFTVFHNAKPAYSTLRNCRGLRWDVCGNNLYKKKYIYIKVLGREFG